MHTPLSPDPLIVVTAPEILSNDGRLLRQMRAFQEAGLRHHFISPASVDQPPPRSLPDVEIINWGQQFLHKAPPSLFLTKAVAHRLRTYAWVRRLVALKPDFVVASAPEALIAASLAKSHHSFTLIYDAHEFYEDELNDSARNAWVKRQHDRYGHNIDTLITVSPGLKQLYAEAHPSWPDASVVTNTPPFTYIPYQNRLHAAANLPPDARIVLFHGALGEGRGLELLPEVARYLDPDIYIVIMGKGPLQTVLEQAPQPKLIRIDPVPYEQLNQYLPGAHLGLILYEPISLNQKYCAPNKLFEYILCNVPILGYACEGLEYFSKDIPEIVLTPFPGSAENIASTINKFVGKAKKAEPFIDAHSYPDFSYAEQKQRFIKMFAAPQ